jgi:hypothetical protein
MVPTQDQQRARELACDSGRILSRFDDAEQLDGLVTHVNAIVSEMELNHLRQLLGREVIVRRERQSRFIAHRLRHVHPELAQP